jgi:hypothetical protein
MHYSQDALIVIHDTLAMLSLPYYRGRRPWLQKNDNWVNFILGWNSGKNPIAIFNNQMSTKGYSELKKNSKWSKPLKVHVFSSFFEPPFSVILLSSFEK